MKQRILITGINGFVGKHLTRELHSQNIAVIGAATSKADPEIADLLDDFVACDLTNRSSVEKIDFSNLSAVIHLAALANQGQSFAKPQEFITTNSAMVINLFESALAQKLSTYPRFIMVSSSVVYDNDQPMPLTEQGALTQNSPYAISKQLGEMLGNYYKKRGIDSVVARPFNHTGPGQGPGYLLPDMVKRIYELGEGEPLKTGNIKTRRDYTDVRDVAKAYALLATAQDVKNHIYNISSGKSRSGEEIISLIAKAMDKNSPLTETNPAFLRPNEPAEIIGSAELLKNDLGWEPSIPLERTIADYVAWYKENRF